MSPTQPKPARVQPDLPPDKGTLSAALSNKKLLDKTLRAREFRWDKVASIVIAAVVLAIVVGLWASSWVRLNGSAGMQRPVGGTVVGLMLGGITVALYGIAAAYSWRHRRRVQQRGMTRVWMELHLALGTVAGISALLHAGPRLGTPIHGAFLVAFEALVLTGLLGKAISVVVPRRLTRIEDEAMLVEDVAAKQKAVRTEIEQLLQNAPDALADLVSTRIPRTIRSPDWYGARRMRRTDVVDAVLASLDTSELVARGMLPEDKTDWLRRVVACHVDEVFLDRMLTYHFILRAWVPAHIALTTLCFPWLLFHMVTTLML